MSFGYSVGDAILLTQLAWRTVQNARKACGEYDELTQETQALHAVIRRLEQELGKPTCPINRDPGTYEEELQVLVDGCNKSLSVLDQVLTKYNALSEPERSGRRLWQKIRFGNGDVLKMADLRARLMYYTSAMSLLLNMVSLGTMGRVERQLHDVGGDLKEIKVSVNEIVAQMMSKGQGREGSILTAYTDDDRAVWKEFRRELVRDGIRSSVVSKHKKLIKSYIEELGSRGLLDDGSLDHEAEEQDLESGLFFNGSFSPNLETHGRGPEMNEGSAVNEEKEQDLKSGSFVNSPSGSDLDIDGCVDTSSGSQVDDDPWAKPEYLTVTETFENLPTIFEHRLKTVASSRVRQSEVGISFSRLIPRTHHSANLPIFDFFDERLIHSAILNRSRILDAIDVIGKDELRFSSLLTIASEYETLELFVFENFEPPPIFSRIRVQKTPISYIIIGYQSLEDLYEMWDEGVDALCQQVIKYQKEGHEIDIEELNQAVWDWCLSIKELWSQESLGGEEMTLGMF